MATIVMTDTETGTEKEIRIKEVIITNVKVINLEEIIEIIIIMIILGIIGVILTKIGIRIMIIITRTQIVTDLTITEITEITTSITTTDKENSPYLLNKTNPKTTTTAPETKTIQIYPISTT
jgi:hypothetical protein